LLRDAGNFVALGCRELSCPRMPGILLPWDARNFIAKAAGNSVGSQLK